MKKKLFAWLLVLAMVMTLLPLTLPTANAADKQYLSFSDNHNGKAGWYMGTDTSDANLELYKVTDSGRTGTRISSISDITDGNRFIIFTQTGSRILHNFQTVSTAQDQRSSGVTITAVDDQDIWTFTAGENGGFTISNDGYYLTADAYVGTLSALQNLNELQVSSTNKVEFKIEEVGNNRFYITIGGEEPEPKTEPRYVAYTDTVDDTGKYGWFVSSTPYAVELYSTTGKSSTSGTQVTDLSQLTSPTVCFIVTTENANTKRAMHNWNDIGTAQCNYPSGQTADLWLISPDDEDGYTISPANPATEAETLYLGQEKYDGTDDTLVKFNELKITNVKTTFQIVPVDDTATFYLTWQVPVEETTDPDPGDGGDDGVDFSTYGTNLFSNMFGSAVDNTWVFTGGANVAGGFDQTRGEHNFSKNFEEYIRWTTVTGNQSKATLQRYVVNTGAHGRTLEDIVKNWETAVSNYHPKAVLYMVGPEDYPGGVESFQENLRQFIGKALELRNGAGYAVILTPINDDSENSKKFTEAVKTVLGEYNDQTADKSRILLVDIFSAIDNDSRYRTSDGWLTEDGHFEVGKKLCEVAYQRTDNYPSSYDNRNATEYGTVPSTFSAVAPSATARGGALIVEVQGNGPWQYELRLENETVKGTANESPFIIPGLPKTGDYVLVIRTDNGDTQLVTVKGSLADGSISSENVPNPSDLSDPQKVIAEKFNDPSSQMTWLFIGDSITHGAQHTRGYDSISELFDKFLEAEGRGEDVVINVGVSGASAYSDSGQQFRNTVGNLNERVTVFGPAGLDVVTIQLGTNDGEDAESFKGHIEDIMKEAWKVSPDAVIVLRTPTAAPGDGWDKNDRYAPKLLELANANPENVIYVDQYTEMRAAMNTYPWIKTQTSKLIFGDNNVHPGVVGQLAMFRDFVEGCGIWTEDNPLTNLYYCVLGSESDNSTPTVDAVDNNDGTHTLTVASSLSNCGEYTLTATCKESQEIFSVTAADANALRLTVPDGTYTVTVSGADKSSATRRTTRAADDVNAGEYQAPEIPEIEPQKPTDQDLNQVTVTVTCTNEFHQGDKSATYQLSQENGGAQVNNVIKGEDGKYTCQVTVEASAYATKFGTGHHAETQNVTITFTYEDGTWTADNTQVTIQVSCDAQPTLSKEEAIEAIGAVTVTDTTTNQTDTYSLEADDVEVGPVNQTGEGYTATVTLNLSSIVDTFEETHELTLTDRGDTEQIVELTYAEGKWTAQPVTVTVASQEDEPPAPPTPVTPPAAVTPGPGDVEIDDEETPLAGALPYEDVMMGDWFYDAAALLYNADVMTGVTETTFVPNASMTRGTVVTLLYRLENEPESGVNVFADVAPNIWYEDAVAWGAENGVVQGFSRTVFGPNRLITREQLAAILYRYATLKGYDTSARTNLLVFSDTSEIDAYAVTAMNWAVASGLLEGRGGKLLAPTGTATRAETAVILSRFINAFVNPEE